MDTSRTPIKYTDKDRMRDALDSRYKIHNSFKNPIRDQAKNQQMEMKEK